MKQSSLILRLLQLLVSAKTVFVLALFVLALPNLCLAFTESVPISYKLVNVILPLPIYAIMLTLWRKPGLMLWCLFPLVFLSAFQIVLIYLYGHSIIAVDMFLNLLTTNPGEVSELLDNLLPGIVFVIVIYIPTLIIATISVWKCLLLPFQRVRIIRMISTIGLLIGLLCLFFFTDKAYRIENDLYPINVFQNIRLAVKRTQATAKYIETSKHFSFHAHSTHPISEREVYVLVIGETARAPQFHLYGYDRETTPHLSKQQNLYVFDKALTQSNTTHKSVPMLLSSVSAIDYDSIYYQKSIIALFKEAGFHTVFFSNQLPNHSFIDFFGKQADEWCFIKEISAKRKENISKGYDTDLLPLVERVLRAKRHKQLIVLHTYGSHFEYRKRYPHTAAYFLPDNVSDAKAINRESLVNAYDNTILYTDRLITDIISRIDSADAVSALLYTSDHGENIFDDNRHIFLHASPIPSYFELHVPLLIWLSPRYQTFNSTIGAALSANAHKQVSTSLSVFHTFVRLAGLSTPYFLPYHSIADSSYHPSSYLYLNDHNEAIPLQQMIKDQQDILYLKRAGMPLPLLSH